MSEDILYKISFKIFNLLNIYLNEVERKFPLNSFTFLRLKRTPKSSIEKLLREFKNIIRDEKLFKYFDFAGKSTIEEYLLATFNGYEKFVKSYDTKFEIKYFRSSDLKHADLSNLYGICGEENELISLIRYLYHVKNFFKLVLINGSIGSRDYKPGWSDIDIFIILKMNTISSKKDLRKLRKITLKIRRYLMNYSLFQDHGVFYSTEYHMYSNYNEFFPIPCLKTGQIITDMEEFQLKSPLDMSSALNYFSRIYKSAKNLYLNSKTKKLDLYSQVLLFHRIFSFPFSFLQCVGVNVGKKESFALITTKFDQLFPNVSDFYNSVNRFYIDWNVNSLHTYKIRKYLGSIFSIKFLNVLFLRKEKEVIRRIYQYYNEFYKNGLIAKFNEYLDIANNYLEQNNPLYFNKALPFLKIDFYKTCIRKIEIVFSKYNQIISVYKFGSIEAPGNSDIDLIFIIKNNIPFYDTIQTLFYSHFSPEERYVVFQHKPFVIPENLSGYINYILPCNNLQKIYGKDIIFKEVSDPYVKLYILIELIIFSSPRRFPKVAIKFEKIREFLQIINTIKFLIKMYNNVTNQFNFVSNIDFQPAINKLKKNNEIRKDMYNYELGKLKEHINESYSILSNLLFKMKISLSKFIEKQVLNEKFIHWKEKYPVLKLGSYLFLTDNTKIIKTNNLKFKQNIYNPWSLYFFFQQSHFLKFNFYKGVRKRNNILIKYLNYTLKFNNGLNLYVPFWFDISIKIRFIQKIWKLIPISLKKKFFIYFTSFRIIDRIMEKITKLILFLSKTIRKIIQY